MWASFHPASMEPVGFSVVVVVVCWFVGRGGLCVCVRARV